MQCINDPLLLFLHLCEKSNQQHFFTFVAEPFYRLNVKLLCTAIETHAQLLVTPCAGMPMYRTATWWNTVLQTQCNLLANADRELLVQCALLVVDEPPTCLAQPGTASH